MSEATEWIDTTLGRAAGMCARRVRPFGGVRPYLATSDVDGYRVQPAETTGFATRPARANLAVEPDDVFQAKMRFTDKAWCANTQMAGWLASTGFAQFAPKDAGSEPRFFFHFLQSERFLASKDALAVGSTQQAIADSVLGAIHVYLPPVAEQAQIAQVLDMLDATIRQTEAIIEKLKHVKQGLLLDLLTRGIDANGELRALRSQAPHLYKESPLGWIPREWIVQRLADFMAAHITYGIVQAGPHIDGGVPYIRTGDMSGTFLKRASLLCTSRRIADSYRRSEVRHGDIVMAIRATVGKVLPVPPDLDGANLTQGTARLAPNARTDARFLLWAIRHQRAQDSIVAEIKGTTFSEITLAALREVPLAAPSAIHEQNLIGERVDACENRIRQEDRQRRKLRKLKAGLVDDLLTGRTRATPLLA